MQLILAKLQLLVFILTLLFLSACIAPPVPPDVATVAPPPTSQQLTDFDVEGHRGTRGLKPENTLPAFETALDLGVNTLELDLHFTNDGEIVIWHEPDIPGTKCSFTGAGEPPANPQISDMTLAQVQGFHCNKNPDPSRFPDQGSAPTMLAGDNYRIITLAQLFDFVESYAGSSDKTDEQRKNAQQVQFNIEIKRKVNDPNAIGDGWDGVNPGPFEQAIVKLVEERGWVDRVIVQSFVHPSLWAVRALNPEIRLAALSSRGRPDPAEYAAQGATIWSPNASDLTPALIAQAHEAELQVIPWTVNEPEMMQKLIDWGVDGIISDRPDLLLEFISPDD